MPNQIKKILIVVLDNLGDAVMATAVIKPIRQVYPGAFIGIWVKKYAAGLFEEQSMIDAVHSSDPFWDTAPGHNKGTFADFYPVWNEVRNQHYDVAFILNTEWRRSVACWLAKIPQRVGFDRRKSGFFLSHGYAPSLNQQHFIEDHLSLVNQFSGSTQNLEKAIPRLDLSVDEEKRGRSWREKEGWENKTVISIHPFTGDERKNWSWENWLRLIKELIGLDDKFRFLILCGPNESYRIESDLILMRSDRIKLLASSSLGVVKAVLAQSQLFIGGDSGPGHIAAALGTPVLSLFGPTDPTRCKPTGSGRIKILKADSLRELSVESVLAEVKLSLR